jgi:hypothetical protein
MNIVGRDLSYLSVSHSAVKNEDEKILSLFW